MKIGFKAAMVGLVAFFAISQEAYAPYQSLPSCPDNSSYSTINACCPPDTDYVCLGTTRWWGCFVSSDFLTVTGKYSCQCFHRDNDSICTNPPSPENDIYIYSQSFPSLVAGQNFCMDLRLKNGNSSSDVCYDITSTKVVSSGVTINWSNQLDTHSYTLCGGDSEWVNNFCGTPASNGSVNFAVKVKISGSYHTVDDFNTGVSSTCSDECTLGQSACSSSTQSWSCVQNSQNCWVKSYVDCPSGQTCFNGSCVQAAVNNPPVLHDPFFYAGVLYIFCTDADNDPISFVAMYLYDSQKSFLDLYYLTLYSGVSSQTTLIYSQDFSSLSNGTYYYVAITTDGKDTTYFPADQSVTQSFTIQNLPATPTIYVSTSTPANNTDYTVTWTNASAGYEIQEATDDGFNGAIGWSQAIPLKTFNHSVSVTTTYYYRVRAIDSYGNSSTWSNTISVTIIVCANECSSGQTDCNGTGQSWSCTQNTSGCWVKTYTTCPSGYACSSGSCQFIFPPNAPVLSVSTTTPANNTAYTANWTNTGVGYEIQEAADNGFSSPTGWSQASTSKTFNHSVSATTTYYYRVRAIDSYGNYGSWSNTISVTITLPCTPNWSCSSWTTCTYNLHTRTCSDTNNCGTTSSMPVTSEPCCISDCISGQMGCSDSATVSKCQIGTDGCYHMLGWQSCNVGTTCSSGSCVQINQPPVLSNWYLDPQTNNFYCTISDPDGDSLNWFKIYVWINGNYVDNSLSPYSGSDIKSGIVYSKNFDFLANGNYQYFLYAGDSKNNYTLYPTSGQIPMFNICHPNWQCGEWGQCYWVEDPNVRWIQSRSCIDMNGCSNQTNQENRPCNCTYTSFEWFPPLSATDGNEAYLKLTWEGSCKDDHLVMQQQIGKPPFCFCSNDVWINKGDFIPITIDPNGTEGNQQTIPWEAFYADASFRMFLERVPSIGSIYTPIMPTSNYMNVKPRSFPANTETLQQAVLLSQLPATCNADLTLTDECYRYWDEMGISFENQLISTFSTYDLIWLGSCTACSGALAIEPNLILSWVGGPETGVPATALMITGRLACDFCSQLPISLTETKAFQVSEAFEANQALKRVYDLADMGITAEYLPSKNGAYVTYLDDAGKEINEVYGISSQGSGSLTFNNKIINFPTEIAEDYHLIDVHRNLVPLNLQSFQASTISFNQETATAYWRTLMNMFEDDIYKLEVEHAWEIGQKGKLGAITNYVQEVQPVIGIDYAHASYEPHYNKWVITFNLENDVLPSVAGGTIPQWQAAVYGMLPHEYIHVASFELIEMFSDPNGIRYVLADIPKRPEATNRWFAEFYAHTIYVDAIKNDPFRYTEYLDSLYGLTHSVPGGVDQWIAEIVQYSKTEATMMKAQSSYQLLKFADPSSADLALSRLPDVDGFLARNEIIEGDVFRAYNDLAIEPGYTATADLDRVLKEYKVIQIPGASIPGTSPSASFNPESSASPSFGCQTFNDPNASNQFSNLVLLMIPLIYVLLRKKFAQQ